MWTAPKYKVKLSNGFEFVAYPGLESWESESALSEQSFSGGLRHVEIECVEGEDNDGLARTLENAILEYVYREDGRSKFMMRELGYGEREAMKLRSDVEYIAMMTGVEL